MSLFLCFRFTVEKAGRLVSLPGLEQAACQGVSTACK